MLLVAVDAKMEEVGGRHRRRPGSGRPMPGSGQQVSVVPRRAARGGVGWDTCHACQVGPWVRLFLPAMLIRPPPSFRQSGMSPYVYRVNVPRSHAQVWCLLARATAQRESRRVCRRAGELQAAAVGARTRATLRRKEAAWR